VKPGAAKRGASAVRNGREFQDEIAKWNDGNLPARGGYAHENEPRFRFVGGKWVPDAKGDRPPDFTACVMGRGILFDAKSTEADKWAVDLIKSHQALALDRHMQAGGVSGILLRLRSRREKVDRWLPWGVVSPVFWFWWDHPDSRAGEFGADDGVPVAGCDWVQALEALP
jgi:hypothetical protein